MAVDPKSPKPPYVQVADALRDDIASGRIKPGGKLPSTRELTDQFSVSAMTAQNAIRTLRDGGWIFTTQRGSFAAEQFPDQSGESSASPDYVAITQHLDAIEGTMRDLADRLQALETEVRSSKRTTQKPETTQRAQGSRARQRSPESE